MLLCTSREVKGADKHELGVQGCRYKLGCQEHSDGTKTPSLNELTHKVVVNRQQKLGLGVMEHSNCRGCGGELNRTKETENVLGTKERVLE